MTLKNPDCFNSGNIQHELMHILGKKTLLYSRFCVRMCTDAVFDNNDYQADESHANK